MEPRGRSLLGNRYELLVPLASGGMGRVWRARDTLLERPVAVKVLRSEFTGDADLPRPLPGRGAAHRRPASSATSHPSSTTARLEEDGERLAYLVMELVEGESLADLLEREVRLERTADPRPPAAGVRRPGRRARRRRGPPRRQAGQRADGHRRGRQDHRLRHRVVGVQRAADRDRTGHRDGALPVTRSRPAAARRRRRATSTRSAPSPTSASPAGAPSRARTPCRSRSSRSARSRSRCRPTSRTGSAGSWSGRWPRTRPSASRTGPRCVPRWTRVTDTGGTAPIGVAGPHGTAVLPLPPLRAAAVPGVATPVPPARPTRRLPVALLLGALAAVVATAVLVVLLQSGAETPTGGHAGVRGRHDVPGASSDGRRRRGGSHRPAGRGRAGRAGRPGAAGAARSGRDRRLPGGPGHGRDSGGRPADRHRGHPVLRRRPPSPPPAPDDGGTTATATATGTGTGTGRRTRRTTRTTDR